MTGTRSIWLGCGTGQATLPLARRGYRSTYSNYRGLEPDTLQRLLDGLATLIDSRYGGRIIMGYLTTLAVAQRR